MSKKKIQMLRYKLHMAWWRIKGRVREEGLGKCYVNLDIICLIFKQNLFLSQTSYKY